MRVRRGRGAPVSHPFIRPHIGARETIEGPRGEGRGVAQSLPSFANIRAVTTSRNHTALAPRAALSGAAEVGRSTVTAGCTAEAYANRLDFARMAFLFVVKNGACEPPVSATTHFCASDHACDFPRGSRARPGTRGTIGRVASSFSIVLHSS